MPLCNVTWSIKKHIGTLEKEISFLRSEINPLSASVALI